MKESDLNGQILQGSVFSTKGALAQLIAIASSRERVAGLGCVYYTLAVNCVYMANG